LIFVTVGTTNFPFDRLFRSIDNVLGELKSEAKLVVQSGNSTYKWKYKNIELHSSLNPKQMELLFSKANKIITHAGYGTLFQISNFSKIKPFIVPRLNNFNEHINSHQSDFLDFLNLRPFMKKKFFDQLNAKNVNISLENYLISTSKINNLKAIFFHEKNYNSLLARVDSFIKKL